MVQISKVNCLKKFRQSLLGVTLLEILVAGAILAVGLSTVFQVFPMGFAASAKASNSVTAYELAARKLEECRGRVLFGGLPVVNEGVATSSTDRWRFWGSQIGPNPDKTPTDPRLVTTSFKFRAFQATDGSGNNTTEEPEKYYFYRVNCVPVVDARIKYREFPFKTTATPKWQGFATMYRLTVTVRGPLKSVEQASDDKFKDFKNAAVEASLSTMVANAQLGNCLLAETKIVRKKHGSGYERYKDPLASRYGTDVNEQNALRSIFVKGYYDNYPYPEHFTVFNITNLCKAEQEDTGPTVLDATGTTFVDRSSSAKGSDGDLLYRDMAEYRNYNAGWRGPGLNAMGLDNVVIFCPLKDSPYNSSHRVASSRNDPNDPSGNTKGCGWVAESNKLIAMYPPNQAPNASTTFWRFDLLNDLYGRDGDYPGRSPGTTAAKSVTERAFLIDKHFDGDIVLSDNNIGYKVGNYDSANSDINGTCVKLLMKLEYHHETGK